MAAGMTAIVILSMVLTPLAVMAIERLTPPEKEVMDGIEEASDLHGRVLFVGFGRFAQVVSQPLLAKGIDVSIIEIDVEMIRAAGQFGFKVYYGDGTRLDVLRASGAATAEAILVCVDKQEAADKIVELVKSEFPHAKIFRARLRPWPRAAPDQCGRGLPASRDIRVRDHLRAAGSD